MNDIAMKILDSMLIDIMDQISKDKQVEKKNIPTQKIIPYTGYRMLTQAETVRLSKASHQLIAKIQLLNIIPYNVFEDFIHELMLSESVFILLEEVKITLEIVLHNYFSKQEIDFIKFTISNSHKCSIVH